VDDICHSLVARPDNSNWTIVTAAPVTSQVIGVFAAVVFTGVILLFQQAPPSEDSDHYRYSSRALVTMLCSFVSLSLASFLFSVVSGEELCGRAFAEGVAAGALFGIGATGMFLSICWLFAAHRIGGHTVIWVKLLMVVEMLAAWTFIAMTVFDAVQAVELTPQNPVTSGLVWWGTTPALSPLLIFAAMRGLPRLRGAIERRAAGMFEMATGFSIFCIVLAIAYFTLITTSTSRGTFPVVVRVGITATVTMAFSLYFINMMTIRRVKAPAKSRLVRTREGLLHLLDLNGR
jgi:hypothetical protein